MRAFREEWKLMISSKFVLKAMLTPLIVSVFFGYLYSHNQINKTSIAVIDEDNSLYSQQLINKVNASQYIDVKSILHQAVDPEMLLANEKYVAVLYLPHGLEQNRYQGKQSNIGFLVDFSVPSATGNLRSAMAEIISLENSTAPTVGKLKALGLTDDQISATISNLSLQQRSLFNPTSDNLNVIGFGYITIVSLGIIYGATLTIVPRLREEGRLADDLKQPIGLYLRVIPYTIVYMIVMILTMAALKQIGGLRFVANPLEYMLPFGLFCLISAWFGMLIGWNAKNPLSAAGRAQQLISPAFLLTGVISPIILFPEPIQIMSNMIPATWYFKFFRGMGLRGGSLTYYWEELGVFLLMLAVISSLLGFLIMKELKKRNQTQMEETLEANEPILLIDRKK
ncbi:ABC transporter permease [Brevibacillus reuszeri]|uniref:ABC transporter permease n=1 Tax=Brevibacillus reuszeri TaxID=54915 RepID=UPI003D1CA45E